MNLPRVLTPASVCVCVAPLLYFIYAVAERMHSSDESVIAKNLETTSYERIRKRKEKKK